MGMTGMQLDGVQQQALVERGYLHLPGVVPAELVEGALRAINSSLGSEGIARDQLPTLRARSFTPELAGAHPICDLYERTSLRTVAEAAIGPGRVRIPTEGQIALRFPG